MIKNYLAKPLGNEQNRGINAEEHSQNRQEITPENRREGQTLPLRQVPQAEPEASQDTGTVVLSELPTATVAGFHIAITLTHLRPTLAPPRPRQLRCESRSVGNKG